jgi:hypothetical protein
MQESTQPPENDEQLQQAVSTRLAKLRSMPVDTTRLAKEVRAEVAPAAVRRVFLPHRLRAVAASFLVIGAVVVGLLVTASGRPVLASAGEMARLHEDLVSGKTPSVQVDSIDAANKVLSERWPRLPEVPEVSEMPREHVMACCMKSVENKKVACVLMKRDGVPVSLVVGHGKEVRAPDSPVTQRNGVDYHVQSSGKLNMIMTQRQGRWICLIGELGPDRLIDVAERLKF